MFAYTHTGFVLAVFEVPADLKLNFCQFWLKDHLSFRDVMRQLQMSGTWKHDKKFGAGPLSLNTREMIMPRYSKAICIDVMCLVPLRVSSSSIKVIVFVIVTCPTIFSTSFVAIFCRRYIHSEFSIGHLYALLMIIATTR